GRQSLGITGETVWRVPSLSLPALAPVDGSDPTTLTARSDAVALFVERVRSSQPRIALTRPNAATVVEICRRLDGIPLALELAAARMRALSLDQLAARLDDRFRLLTGGSRTALPRHQTLQATIDWSYELITPA